MRRGAPLIAVAVFGACLAAAGRSEAKGAGACLPGLRSALVAGRFSGSVNCVDDRLSARLVGRLTAGRHRFAIYDYRYTLKLMCPECAIHGGQRIVVLRDGRYIGQFMVVSFAASVVDGKLELTPFGDIDPTDKDRRPVSIPFSPSGPSPTAEVDGQVIDFFR